MNANTKNEALVGRAARRGFQISLNAAAILRRAELTLTRWAELECGDCNAYYSWAISRNEKTGKPEMVTIDRSGKSRTRAIPDKEKGALARVAKTCAAEGLHFYHQTDPRGVALYVASVPLTDQNYNTAGVSCAV